MVRKLELEVGTDILLLETGDALLLGALTFSGAATATGVGTLTCDARPLLWLEQRKATYKGRLKVALTKSGETTYTYYNYDRVRYLEFTEQPNSYISNIVLDNSDNVLTAIDLTGYTATISWGMKTEEGDLYSKRAPLYVLYQTFNSRGGALSCSLTCIGIINKVNEQAASNNYLPPTTAMTDLVGAVKTQAAVGASSVALKSLGVSATIPIDTKLTITGDSTEYNVEATTTTDGGGDATVTILPVLAVQAEVDVVATLALATLKDIIEGLCDGLGHGYTLYGAVSIAWDSEDSLIDSLVIKDYFKVREGASRLSKVNEAIGYTKMVKRVKSDGKIHFFNPTISGTDYNYQYVISGGHTFFAKSYSTSLIIPNTIIIRTSPALYQGSANDATSWGLLPKYVIYTLPIISDAQGDTIATAMLQRATLAAQRGSVVVPMNVFEELWDYIKVTDARESDSVRTGNVQYLRRTWNARTGEFQMVIRLGDSAVGLPDASTGALEFAPATPDYVTYPALEYYLLQLIELISGLTDDALDDDARLAAIEAVVGVQVVDARIDDTINSGDATTDGVIDAIRDALVTWRAIAPS